MEKIIFFTPCFYKPSDPRSTGGTISNYHLFKELSGNYDVTIVTPESSADFDFPLNIITSKYTKDVYSSSLIARSKRLFRFFWFKKVAKKMNRNEYAYAFFTNGAIISCFKWFKCSNKIILTRAFEDFYHIDEKSRFLKRVFFKIMSKKTKKCYKTADSIITNSIFMKDRIISEFKKNNERVHVLYPPIHCPLEQGFALKKSEDITIGMINPTKIKGEEIFIKLAENFEKVKFCYFSRSDRNYPHSNIDYKGWASTTENIFKEIDILLVPSQWEEPFGRVAAEGILYGKPVLVSNRGGLPEIVHESFISDYSDPNSWIESVNEIINKYDLTKSAWEESYSNCKSFLPKNHKLKLEEILKKSKKAS